MSMIILAEFGCPNCGENTQLDITEAIGYGATIDHTVVIDVACVHCGESVRQEFGEAH